MYKMRRFKKGCTAIELLFVTSIITSISAGSYVAAKKKATALFCRNNLSQINQAITMFEMQNNDRLPDAVFYPKEPDDPKAINNILKSFCGTKVFICPSLPDELKKRGLTYIWNDEFSNKRRDRMGDPGKKWLMIEMTAVDSKIPPPHSGGYNILYVDGHIEQSQTAPSFVPKEG